MSDYSESSGDEAPQEISFAQAQQQEKQRRKETPGIIKKIQKKTEKKKIRPRETVQADPDEDKLFEQKMEKFERADRKSQVVRLNPVETAVEQKIGKNMKVIMLKKTPVIPKNSNYLEARNAMLHRADLRRRPLNLSK